MVSVLDTLPNEAGAVAVVGTATYRPRRVSQGLFVSAGGTSTRRRLNSVALAQLEVGELALMGHQRFPFGPVISV